MLPAVVVVGVGVTVCATVVRVFTVGMSFMFAMVMLVYRMRMRIVVCVVILILKMRVGMCLRFTMMIMIAVGVCMRGGPVLVEFCHLLFLIFFSVLMFAIAILFLTHSQFPAVMVVSMVVMAMRLHLIVISIIVVGSVLPMTFYSDVQQRNENHRQEGEY